MTSEMLKMISSCENRLCAKEHSQQLEGEFAGLKKQNERKNKSLAEHDKLLAADKKKNSFYTSEMKRLEEKITQLKAKVADDDAAKRSLQDQLKGSEAERKAELIEAGYDAYREAERLWVGSIPLNHSMVSKMGNSGISMISTIPSF
jgi:chromosome segregation ATPase